MGVAGLALEPQRHKEHEEELFFCYVSSFMVQTQNSSPSTEGAIRIL